MQWPWLDQAKHRAQELLSSLPRGYKSPGTWTIFHCLPRPLAGRWIGSRTDKKQYPYRMLMLQATALLKMSQDGLQNDFFLILACMGSSTSPLQNCKDFEKFSKVFWTQITSSFTSIFCELVKLPLTIPRELFQSKLAFQTSSRTIVPGGT